MHFNKHVLTRLMKFLVVDGSRYVNFNIAIDMLIVALLVCNLIYQKSIK